MAWDSGGGITPKHLLVLFYSWPPQLYITQEIPWTDFQVPRFLPAHSAPLLLFSQSWDAVPRWNCHGMMCLYKPNRREIIIPPTFNYESGIYLIPGTCCKLNTPQLPAFITFVTVQILHCIKKTWFSKPTWKFPFFLTFSLAKGPTVRPFN